MDSLDKFNAELRVMAGQMNGLIKSLPGQIGALALESIDDNFRSQSFFGTPWQARKEEKGSEGRAILVLTGRLRRSFKLQNSGLNIVLFTDVPYAEIHNEGGKVTGTADVAEHTRKQHELNEISKPGSKKEKWKKETVGSHKVRAHSRKVDFEMPQRQYMGEHPELDNRIISLLERNLGPIFDG